MKYFLPFGDFFDHDPYVFYNEILKRKDHISGIYFGFLPKEIGEPNIDKILRIKTFLEFIKNIPIEKFVTLNAPKIQIRNKDLQLSLSVLEMFKEYITGVSVSNLFLAEFISKNYPNLKIDISVNSFTYTPNSIDFWKRHIENLYSINLPREYVRKSEDIDEYRKYGLKIKVIVNEGCLFGCPFSCYCNNLEGKHFCQYTNRLSDILRSVWISPSRLNEIKEKIDIAKIVHRISPFRKIFSVLDYYINANDSCDLFNFVSSQQEINFLTKKKEFLRIPINKIPGKVYTCECKECSDCNICEKFMEKMIKDNFKDGNIGEEEMKNFLSRV